MSDNICTDLWPLIISFLRLPEKMGQFRAVSKHFKMLVDSDISALHEEANQCDDQFGKGLIYLRESYLPKIHLLGMHYIFDFNLMRRMAEMFIKYDLYNVIDINDIICPKFHKSDFDVMSDRLAISYLTRHTVITGVLFLFHIQEIIAFNNIRLTHKILSRKDFYIIGSVFNEIESCDHNESYHMVLNAESYGINILHRIDFPFEFKSYNYTWETYLREPED